MSLHVPLLTDCPLLGSIVRGVVRLRMCSYPSAQKDLIQSENIMSELLVPSPSIGPYFHRSGTNIQFTSLLGKCLQDLLQVCMHVSVSCVHCVYCTLLPTILAIHSFSSYYPLGTLLYAHYTHTLVLYHMLLPTLTSTQNAPSRVQCWLGRVE